MATVQNLNCRILDFLGISRECKSVDIFIRLDSPPIVNVTRYVLPHQIVDDALVTEEKRFYLVAADFVWPEGKEPK